jgi:hypothetical protein
MSEPYVLPIPNSKLSMLLGMLHKNFLDIFRHRRDKNLLKNTVFHNMYNFTRKPLKKQYLLWLDPHKHAQRNDLL